MPAYSTIRTELRALLKRGTNVAADALLDQFLADSIKRIQRVVRIPAQEKSVEVTLDDSNYFTNGRLLIPSDYIKLKSIQVTDAAGIRRELARKDLEYVLALADQEPGSMPAYFARQGASWVLAPGPSEDAVVRIDYLSEFEDIDSDDDETILTDIASDAMKYGALSIACDYFNDPRGERFEARFVQIISDLQAQGDDDELTGGAVVEQAFTYPSDT